MNKSVNLPTATNITSGSLDSNAGSGDGLYPFFTCAPIPLRINEYAFDCDAILLAGNNAQGNFHINRYKGKFNAYQRTYVLTKKEGFDLDYIYYNLKLSLNNLKQISQGSQTKFLTLEILNSFKLPKLGLDEQEKIAKTLINIDRRINLNNNINRELEEMARTIYNYWFVQFDFPDDNGKPYKTSGGEMGYNEILKMETPKEWEDGKLCEVAEITMGQSPPGETYNEYGEGTVFYQGSTDFNFRFPTTRMYTTAPSRNAKKGDVLLSVRAPVGTVNVAYENCCIGRGLAALSSKIQANSYLLYLMLYFETWFDIQNRSGTTFGAIDKDILYDLKFAKPPEEVQKQFQKIVGKYDQMIKDRSRENQELTKLRDFLLPLLMIGQVRVQ